MPGFLEPIWETVFRAATWAALIFGALSIGSAFVSAWVGWEITDATQKDADRRIKSADERIAEYQARTKEAELALARLSAPRALSPAQMQDLIARLRPHAGKKFWVIIEKVDDDAGAEQVVFANQLSSAFLAAGWLKTSHSLIDPTKEDPESTPVNDRGCNVASAPDAKSMAVRGDVLAALKDAGVECVSNVAPTLLPEFISLEIGLR